MTSRRRLLVLAAVALAGVAAWTLGGGRAERPAQDAAVEARPAPSPPTLAPGAHPGADPAPDPAPGSPPRDGGREPVRVRGRLLGAGRVPAAGSVFAFGAAEREGGPFVAVRGATGQDGSFDLIAPYPWVGDRWALRIGGQVPGRALVERHVEVVPGAAVEVELFEEGVPFHGRVVDPAGRPVAGLVVAFGVTGQDLVHDLALGGDLAHFTRARSITSSSGEFVVEGVHDPAALRNPRSVDPAWELEWEEPSPYVRGTLPSERAVVVARPTYLLRGAVTDAVTGGRIRSSQAFEIRARGVSTTRRVGDDLWLREPNHSGGAVQVTVRVDAVGYRSAERTVTFEGAQAKTVDVALHPLTADELARVVLHSRLRGDDGRPVPILVERIERWRDEVLMRPVPLVRTDHGFEATVPAGRVMLRGVADVSFGHFTEWTVDVAAPASGEVRVEVPWPATGSVRFRIPTGRCRVYVDPPGDEPLDERSVSVHEPEGVLRVVALPVGDWTGWVEELGRMRERPTTSGGGEPGRRRAFRVEEGQVAEVDLR